MVYSSEQIHEHSAIAFLSNSVYCLKTATYHNLTLKSDKTLIVNPDRSCFLYRQQNCCRYIKKHVDGNKWIQLVSGNMCPDVNVA